MLGPRVDAESEMPSGLSVAEAREALAYWRARQSRLPWHRLAARAEARTMARRWHARLLRAHLERWRLGFLQRALAPLLAMPELGADRAHDVALMAFPRVARRARRLLLAVAVAFAITVLAVWALIVAALIHLL
jgi:hypothetical protein